jgi:pectin-derived oligosaccharide transport system substrate-binding protein
MQPDTPRPTGAPAVPAHRTRPSSRRLLAALGLGIVLVASGCATSGPPAPAPIEVAPIETGPVEISIFWWGGDARAQLTHQVLELYTKKHPNVTFKETWQANAGYIDKLNTNLAANAAADIFQLDDNMLGGVAARNQTLDLTNYIAAKRIDVAKLSGSLVDYGKVNGKQAAVPLAENTPGMVYNKTVVQKYGVEEPQIGWSWEKLISWATDLSAKSNYTVYGTMDPSADYKAFWVWLRQQGKDFYNGTKLGFTEQDLTRWFDLWKGARAAKAAPPADIIHTANAGDVTKQLVVTGQAATSFMWSNQMPELAKNTKDTLGVVSYPGDPKGQWARAALYFAGYANTTHPGIVVDVMNFFINDPDAGKILGTERGLPANSDIRTAVTASLTDANMKATVDFENKITPKFGPAPNVPPNGAAAVRTLLIQEAEKVQFGQMDSAAAAKEFVEQANLKLTA